MQVDGPANSQQVGAILYSSHDLVEQSVVRPLLHIRIEFLRGMKCLELWLLFNLAPLLVGLLHMGDFVLCKVLNKFALVDDSHKCTWTNLLYCSLNSSNRNKRLWKYVVRYVGNTITNAWFSSPYCSSRSGSRSASLYTTFTTLFETFLLNWGLSAFSYEDSHFQQLFTGSKVHLS